MDNLPNSHTVKWVKAFYYYGGAFAIPPKKVLPTP